MLLSLQYLDVISCPINFNHSKINNEIHNVWEGLTEEQCME